MEIWESTLETGNILNDVKNSQEVQAGILARLESNRQYRIEKIREKEPHLSIEEIKKKIAPPNEHDIYMTAVGEVFEQVIQREPEIIPQETEVAKEITALIENPLRYNLDEKLALTRHPDALYIETTETGTILIKGAGEAKLGKLNARAVDQLETFLENIKKIAAFIEKTSAEELEKYGLVELAKRKRAHQEQSEEPLVEISDKFRVTLIIPQDRSQKYKDLVNEEEVPKNKYEQLMKRIIKIKRSQYTGDEIRNTTRDILKNWK